MSHTNIKDDETWYRAATASLDKCFLKSDFKEPQDIPKYLSATDEQSTSRGIPHIGIKKFSKATYILQDAFMISPSVN